MHQDGAQGWPIGRIKGRTQLFNAGTLGRRFRRLVRLGQVAQPSRTSASLDGQRVAQLQRTTAVTVLLLHASYLINGNNDKHHVC